MRTFATDFHKIIIEKGGVKPCEHDRVVVQIAVYLNNECKIPGQLLTFDLGHAEDFGVVKFFDHIVETMGLGEQCSVTIPVCQALSSSECEQLGIESHYPQDELCLTLRLADIKKIKKFWELSESEKLLMASVMKRRGNKLVKEKQYIRAFRTYKLGVDFLRGSVSVQPVRADRCEITTLQSDEACQLLVLCLSNAALCLLRLVSLVGPGSKTDHLTESARQMVLLCIKYCTLATELDSTYAKGWFRLAKAHALLGDYTEAVQFGERSLQCLKINATVNEGCEQLIREVQGSLASWRVASSDATRLERTAVRQAVLRRYRDSHAWSDDDDDDDEDAIEKLPISVWSNDLAANMMSLHEELEAFGEKMPEPNMSRSGRSANKASSSRLSVIEDEDSEMGEVV